MSGQVKRRRKYLNLKHKLEIISSINVGEIWSFSQHNFNNF